MPHKNSSDSILVLKQLIDDQRSINSLISHFDRERQEQLERDEHSLLVQNQSKQSNYQMYVKVVEEDRIRERNLEMERNWNVFLKELLIQLSSLRYPSHLLTSLGSYPIDKESQLYNDICDTLISSPDDGPLLREEVIRKVASYIANRGVSTKAISVAQSRLSSLLNDIELLQQRLQEAVHKRNVDLLQQVTSDPLYSRLARDRLLQPPFSTAQEILVSNASLPVVATSTASSSWLQELEERTKTCRLPDDWAEELRIQMDLLGSDRLDCISTLSDNLDLIEKLVDLLTRSAETIGSTAFLSILLQIVKTILLTAGMIGDEEKLLQLGFVLGTVLSRLPGALRDQSRSVVTSSLSDACCFCSPILPSQSKSSIASSSVSDQQVRLVVLQAAMFSCSIGLQQQVVQWLCSFCRQMSVCSSAVLDMDRFCLLIRLFLRLTGHCISQNFQSSLVEMLTLFRSQRLSGPVGKEGSKLASFIDRFLEHRIIEPVYFKGQDPQTVEAIIMSREVDVVKRDVVNWEKDKTCELMQKIKRLQIDRLRVVFNKLGASKESQQVAVTSLLEKIVSSSQESKQLLRYTLFKIADTIASDCQEEFFIETDEAHPLKLVRVACELSSKLPDLLPNAIRGHWYRHCPLSIPKTQPQEGFTGDAFFTDMGFRHRIVKDPQGGATTLWEDKTVWLCRMSKLLVTFGVMVVQPEQSPFSLEDGWRWLGTVINQCRFHKPSFFIATAMEVVLRM